MGLLKMVFFFICSRQRHNKLWRSHSDSDLSEHHEPLAKSHAQPQSLGRSDPHSQASDTTETSMKELLGPLGDLPSTDKAAHSSSKSDTGVQSNQPDSSSAGEATSLFGPSLSAVAQVQGELSPPSRDPAARCASPLSPPLSNGLSDSEERPSSPPLSQPRAATLVPEPQKVDISMVTVAESVLVDQPHPPPSLHHLPLSPAPSPTPAFTDELIGCSLPVVKPSHQLHMPASVPEPVTSLTPSAQHVGPRALSAPVPDEKPDCDQELCGLTFDSLVAHPPSTSDLISYPSAIQQDGEVSFAHSADHINFFSAREKFRGLSQDGKSQCVAVQPSAQRRSCVKEQQAVQQDSTGDGKEREKRKVRVVNESIREYQLIMSMISRCTS